MRRLEMNTDVLELVLVIHMILNCKLIRLIGFWDVLHLDN